MITQPADIPEIMILCQINHKPRTPSHFGLTVATVNLPAWVSEGVLWVSVTYRTDPARKSFGTFGMETAVALEQRDLDG